MRYAQIVRITQRDSDAIIAKLDTLEGLQMGKNSANPVFVMAMEIFVMRYSMWNSVLPTLADFEEIFVDCGPNFTLE